MTRFRRPAWSYRVSLESGCFIVLAISLIAFTIDLREIWEPVDFIAFFCGGDAVRLHLDPYLAQSLNACEHATSINLYYGILSPVIIPAPFPAYTLAFFSLFSYLPPLIAYGTWIFLLIASFIGSILFLRNIVTIPLTVIIATISTYFFMLSLPLGQIVPIIVFAICAALWGIKHDKHHLTAFAAVCTLLEPHIGLAFCLAIFLVVPHTRRPLCLWGAAFGAIWITALPAQVNGEYLRHVVSAHALSEAFNDDQYSLTHLLVLFGLNPFSAVSLGAWSYVVMVVLGCVGARHIFRKTADPCLAAVFAPTCALLGGPFIHIQQMAIASIAGLIAYDRTPQRKLTGIALIAITLPIGAARTSVHLIAIMALGAILIVGLLGVRQPRTIRLHVIFIGFCVTISAFLVSGRFSDTAYHRHALAFLTAHPALFSNPSLEMSWLAFIIDQHTSLGYITLGAHLVIWSAIIVTLLSMYRSTTRETG